MASNSTCTTEAPDAISLLNSVRQDWAKPVTQESIERACKRNGIRLLVLFGSLAKGRTHSESDVDVGYLLEPNRRPGLLRLYGQLAPALGTERLDLVRMRDALPLLAINIATSGKVIYATDKADWTSYAVHAMQEWDDVRKFEPFRLVELDRSLRNWGIA